MGGDGAIIVYNIHTDVSFFTFPLGSEYIASTI